MLRIEGLSDMRMVIGEWLNPRENTQSLSFYSGREEKLVRKHPELLDPVKVVVKGCKSSEESEIGRDFVVIGKWGKLHMFVHKHLSHGDGVSVYTDYEEPKTTVLK